MAIEREHRRLKEVEARIAEVDISSVYKRGKIYMDAAFSQIPLFGRGVRDRPFAILMLGMAQIEFEQVVLYYSLRDDDMPQDRREHLLRNVTLVALCSEYSDKIANSPNLTDEEISALLAELREKVKPAQGTDQKEAGQ